MRLWATETFTSLVKIRFWFQPKEPENKETSVFWHWQCVISQCLQLKWQSVMLTETPRTGVCSNKTQKKVKKLSRRTLFSRSSTTKTACFIKTLQSGLKRSSTKSSRLHVALDLAWFSMHMDQFGYSERIIVASLVSRTKPWLKILSRLNFLNKTKSSLLTSKLLIVLHHLQ